MKEIQHPVEAMTFEVELPDGYGWEVMVKREGHVTINGTKVHHTELRRFRHFLTILIEMIELDGSR